MAINNQFIVYKSFEPTGAYKKSLMELSRPDDYKLIGRPLGLVIEERMMTYTEADIVGVRDHIISVEPVQTFSVPEPIVTKESDGAVPGHRARSYHGIDKVHALGVGGAGQKVAVLDTGTTLKAAAMLGTRLQNTVSFIEGEGSEDTEVDSSHGTWCLGTIADVAPDATLLSAKVLSSKTGSGTTSGIIQGIAWAVKQGATVINESLGGGRSKALDAAVDAARAKGVLMPCAAGNDQRGRTDYTADTHSPGAASGAICVPAVNIGSEVTDFSSWGNSCDVAAIGYKISNGWQPGAYSGTSMATPFVSGICALLLSMGKKPDEVEKALYAMARNTTLEPFKEGHGIADAFAAYQSLSGVPEPPTPLPIPELKSWQKRGWESYSRDGGLTVQGRPSYSELDDRSWKEFVRKDELKEDDLVVVVRYK